MKVSMTELANQIANNEEGVTKSVKKVREEMSAQDDPDSKVLPQQHQFNDTCLGPASQVSSQGEGASIADCQTQL